MRESKGLAIVAIALSLGFGMGGTVSAAPKVMNWLACKTGVQLEGFNKLFKEYQADTGYKMNVAVTDWGSYQSKILMTVASGKFMDFYAWGTDYYAGLSQAKALVPLDSYIKGSRFDMSKQSKAGLKTWTYKGQVWGMPYAFYPVILYYNRNLFDAAGLPYPTANWDDRSWNWETFLDYSKKLTKRDEKGRVQQSGLGGMQWQYFYPWYFGGDWSDEKLTESRLTDPKTLKGLQEIADLSLKYKVTGGDFNAGKAAMMVEGCWSMAGMNKVKFKWNIAASPWGTDHSVPAFVDAFSVGYGKQAANSWNLIKWMYADKERVNRWIDADSGGSAVPTDKDLLARYIENGKKALPGINLQVCVDALEYAQPLNLRYSRNWPKINQVIDPAWNDILSGKKPAKDAMASINAQVDKLIKGGGTR